MSTTTTAAAAPQTLEDFEDLLEAAQETLKSALAAQAKADSEVTKARDAVQALRARTRGLESQERLAQAKEKAMARIAKLEASVGECGCGCGVPHAAGRTFAQGHDMRAKSQVKKFRAGELTLDQLGPWARNEVSG